MELSFDKKPKEDAKSIFGQPKKGNNEIEDLLREVNSMNRRLRLIEEQYTNIRRRMQVTDQNMLAYHKKNSTEEKAINLEISELRRLMEELDGKVMLIIKELRLCAKKEEIAVLQKYISMWEPVNFVTRNEVEKMFKDYMGERKF